MCCLCQIVPERVLKRLAADRKYSAEQRKNFADTIKIDTQLRRLRTQAARVAGSESLVMRYTTSTVFLPFFVTVRRSCAT